MITPDNWIEEDREELIEAIVDGMVSRMTLEDMRRVVWDLHYEDVICQQPEDVIVLAEEYAPELLKQE
jgi:hypothetical protein